jgi:hypothetical protein
MSITEHELAQCQRANQTGRQPVVFVHGLWLLPSSWDRWAALFEDNGSTALTPGWPDDPDTVAEATAHPEVFAGKSIGQIADHFATPPAATANLNPWTEAKVVPRTSRSVTAPAASTPATPAAPGTRRRQGRIRLPAGAVADGHSLGVADSGGGPRALLAERGRLNQPALPGERTRSAGAG